MPWDGGLLYVADVTIGSSGTLTIGEPRYVAGKYQEASAGYPSWVSNDTLLYTVDVSGFQNPWTYSLATQSSSPVLKSPKDEDFNEPAWILGGSHNAVLDSNGHTVLFTALREVRSVLYQITLKTGATEELESPFVTIESVRRVTDSNVVFIGSQIDEPAAIILCTTSPYEKPQFKQLKSSASASANPVPKEYLSKPQSLAIDVNGQPVYAVYYPPTNPDFVAPAGELPPCVVNVHGGPTSSDDQSLKMLVQYFTTRGFAW